MIKKHRGHVWIDKEAANFSMYGVVNLSGTGVSQSKVLSHKTCRIVLVLKVIERLDPKDSTGVHIAIKFIS